MISIIIPVYNRIKELNRAINSVLNQTIVDWELLVVDDCSESDIKNVLDSFQDIRIRYFRFEKKGNANICRNLGIKEAKGDYIAMLDSDDEWLPNHLELCSKNLSQINADGIFSSYKVFDGDNYSLSIIRPFRKGEQMVNYILDGNSTATPTHFYKTECARDVLWDESLLRHQDYDFAIRFALKYSFVPIQLFTVVVHWRKNEKRNEHFPSQIRFLEKHKAQINRKMFVKYNREVLSALLKRKDVESSIINYFRGNFLNNIKELSLIDYISVYGNNVSSIKKLQLRLSYVTKVLFS